MGTLYLVRHGQASLGAEDYDQLSPLGERQCARLGRYFADRQIRFDAVITGTLRRHRQSLANIAEAYAETQAALPAAREWPGLDEYDSSAIIGAVHRGPLTPPKDIEQAKEHFRLLRSGLAAWMDRRSEPRGVPSFADFQAGVVGALELALPHHQGNVLLVSSGGPISCAVGHLLALQAPAIIDLNMRLRNSAVTEFSFNASRHMLLTWNTLPHLDHRDGADWVTFA